MLCSHLKCLVAIKGLLECMPLLSAVGENEALVSVLAPEGDFVVSEATVASFLKDASSNSSADLAGLK